jgi:hypothetical protein
MHAWGYLQCGFVLSKNAGIFCMLDNIWNVGLYCPKMLCVSAFFLQLFGFRV